MIELSLLDICAHTMRFKVQHNNEAMDKANKTSFCPDNNRT